MIKKRPSSRLLHFIVLFSLFLFPALAKAETEDKTIRIGVLAHRGDAKAIKRWTPTAEYLSSKITDHHFEIVPLNLKNMSSIIENDAIQFTLTNPGNYADLEERFGISRIATLQKRENDQVRVRYAAVIITRSDNTSIQNLEDLKNKSFMAVSAEAFGGFQMAWRELLEHGIDPFTDIKDLRFAGFPQDKIVMAVQNGKVDAATVRAETFARMIESGIIDANDFRVLNHQDNTTEPFQISTRLYPEWPFATLKNTPRDLATRVTQALLSMTDNHPAALASKSAGWTIPLDYSPVNDLMRSLKIGSYEALRETSLLALMKRYAYWLFAAGLALISLITLNGYVTRTNHRLRETERDLRLEISQREASQTALTKYRDTLEEQVLARTHDLQLTNQGLDKSRVALRKLVQITSAPELNHEQRLQQLLETGREYFELNLAVLASIEDDEQKVSSLSGDINLAPENQGPLNQRCASHLIEQLGEPLDIPDVASYAGADSCCNKQGWKSYLGVGVMVEGNICCTLEFAGIEKRQSLLSQWDHELLKVMAQWIADELERQRAFESERRHEIEFARVSRLSTIGEMAASLAHELNQPLTGTLNYSNSCLRLLKKPNPDIAKLTQGIEHAVEGATMAADIIRHIRQFVQKGEERYTEVDLNQAVLNAATLINHEIQKHDVTLELDLNQSIAKIEGNLIQIEQVILNFIRNSIEAMDRIDKKNHHLIIKTDITTSGMIRLAVIDSGEGIEEDYLPKIFDAFFSTKNKGMGIGLSISRTIIESHQGRISTRALDEGGTEFAFEIPAAMES